jgi:outer membrane protein OmpA-like peptidoglycan-associated protein
MPSSRFHFLLKPQIIAAATTLILSACSPGSQLDDVRGQPVPTATFLFFDKDSDNLQPDSVPVLRQAAAYLVQYDNTFARIVGHIAPDEPFDLPVGQRLDTRRATTVGTQLMQLGVQAERIQPFSAGKTENMSTSPKNAAIDRRVDIIFGVR